MKAVVVVVVAAVAAVTATVMMVSYSIKIENILKGNLDSIPFPSIMYRKVCLRCKGITLLGFVNKVLKTKNVLTSPSNVLPQYLSSKLTANSLNFH